MLGALSLLLNGGGVAQMKTIASELNLALEGREDSAKSVFRQIRDLMSQLDEGKADIVDAIEGLNRLSHRGQRPDRHHRRRARGAAQRAADPRQAARATWSGCCRRSTELGDVGVRVIKASKQATIESFRQLVPVLTQFANSGDAFVDAFHVFLTYPFVDEVVGRDPQVARNLHMGDYTNLSIQLDVDRRGRRRAGGDRPADRPADRHRPDRDPRRRPQVHRSPATSPARPARRCSPTPQKLAELQEECAKKKNRDKDVCKQLNAVPGLPTAGGQWLRSTRSPPACRSPMAGARLVGLTVEPPGAHVGPTMGELMDVYDPGPGLAARPGDGDPMIDASYQDPAAGLRDHHAGRRQLRRRPLRPARPAVLRRHLHGRRALHRVRRHLRRRRGDLPRRQDRPGRASSSSPTPASTSSSTSTRTTTRSPPTRSPWSATARRSASSTSSCSRRADDEPFLERGLGDRRPRTPGPRSRPRPCSPTSRTRWSRSTRTRCRRP